jgi:hypothetical protein
MSWSEVDRHGAPGARGSLQLRLDGAVDTAGVGRPAQVILISTLAPRPWSVAVAVTLSSVRFCRWWPRSCRCSAAGTRQRELLLPMHLLSASGSGIRLLPSRPRGNALHSTMEARRGPDVAALIGGAFGFYLATKLPPLLAASLLFFTPLALLMSASRNSRTLLDRLAFGLGLLLGPVIAAQKIGLDLMWTGLIAGSIAYAVHWVREARR